MLLLKQKRRALRDLRKTRLHLVKIILIWSATDCDLPCYFSIVSLCAKRAKEIN